MRRIMGWKKTIDVGIDIDKIETPWLNQTYWDSLPAKSRWELRKDQFYLTFHPHFTSISPRFFSCASIFFYPWTPVW